MDGRTQPGDEQPERFPARSLSGWLPPFAEERSPEHPLSRAGRLLGVHRPPEPGEEPSRAPGLQEKLDELTRRLRQVQRSLTPLPESHPVHEPDLPARLHQRLGQFLEEWNLWQDQRSTRDPARELAEFCRSDYMEKLVRLHALAFLIVDPDGLLLHISPGLLALEAFAGLHAGQTFEDSLLLLPDPRSGGTQLQARAHARSGYPVEQWPLPGGRLICLSVGAPA